MDLSIIQDDAMPGCVQIEEKGYEYTFEDFTTPIPYERLYAHIGSPFLFQAEVAKVAERAKEVKFKNFKGMLKTYLEAMQIDRRKNMVPQKFRLLQKTDDGYKPVKLIFQNKTEYEKLLDSASVLDPDGLPAMDDIMS